MPNGIVQTIGGAALIGLGLALEFGTAGGSTALTAFLIKAGAGIAIAGIGTMISGIGAITGLATTTRNSVSPWLRVYGRSRVGGSTVYISSFGDSNKYLDLIAVLASHPSKSVDALMFDQQRVLIGSITNTTNGWYGTSGSPSLLNFPRTCADIKRINSTVTVRLSIDIAILEDGDQILMQNVPGDLTLNGKYNVFDVSHGGGVCTFSYLNGGSPAHVINAGQALTQYPDYGNKVYMEVMLGTQTVGQSFVGEVDSTPNDGNPADRVVNVENGWNNTSSLAGMTAVMLRLHYNDAIFANGIPQISFHMSGKNDIRDDRTSPPTFGYSENAALCIADYLADTDIGFKAIYGAEIPIAPLVAAANICDERVALAEPPTSPPATEPRYMVNGSFAVTTRRGEVLQNLLTACAGRITYVGGQFVIWPAAWYGISGNVTGGSIYSMATGVIEWTPKVSVTDLYNGVKGTFVSPSNNWVASDFPRYAQDATHGYTWGVGPTHDQNLDDDGGDRLWLDIQLPFTITSAAAQRLAKIELLRRRQQGTGAFMLNMGAYIYTPMDVLAMDFSYLAWTAKALEILALRLELAKAPGSDAPLLGVEIDVQETDSSVYFWSIGEELSAAGFQQAITPSTLTPAPPTNVVLSNGPESVIVTWDAPADAFVLNGGHIEVEYQVVASPEGLWFSLARMDPTVTQAIIPNLILGQSYNVRIRSVNAAGVPSVWVYGTPDGASGPGPISINAALPWVPGYAAPLTGDAVYINGGPSSFGLKPVYDADGRGNPKINIDIKGGLPINDLSTIAKPPVIVCTAGTAGSFDPGVYIVAVSALDIGDPVRNTKYSNFQVVVIPPGPSNGSIHLALLGIGSPPEFWDPMSDGGEIYVASPSVSNGFHFARTLSGLATSATLTEFDSSQAGGPDPLAYREAIQWAEEIHGGPWAQQVQNVTPTVITIAGDGMTTNQWQGYTLSLLAQYNPLKETQLINMPVASSTASVAGFFTLTIGPNSKGDQLLDLTLVLDNGDLVVIRSNPTFTDTGFSDPNIANSYFPVGATGVEAGHLAYVVNGPDAGDLQVIGGVVPVSGLYYTFELAGSWKIRPNAGDIVLILAQSFSPEVKTNHTLIPNRTALFGTIASPDVLNLAGKTWFIRVAVEDVNGVSGDPSFDPFREIYIFPAQGTRLVKTSQTIFGNASSDNPGVPDRILVCDTSDITGTTDNLASDITNTTGTAVTLASGAATVNGTYMQINGEIMKITEGGGTPNLTVRRGQLGTAPDTHMVMSPPAGVMVAGKLVLTFLPIDQMRNQDLIIKKVSGDINYVELDTAMGDTFPGGLTVEIIPSSDPSESTISFTAPGV